MRQRSYTEERMDRDAQRWLDRQEFDCVYCGEPVAFGESVTLMDPGDHGWAGEAHEDCWADGSTAG